MSRAHKYELIIWRVLFVALLVMTLQASAAWLTGYKYRKSVPITGAAGAGTNYQVKVTVNSGVGDDAPGVAYLDGLASYFPNDVAFAGNNGSSELSYWREDATTFWVKVADSLESSASIYIYYGLATGTSKKDPITYTDARLERYASNPILAVGAAGAWDDFWVGISSIVDNRAVDGKWYAYYDGQRESTGLRTGLATSTDGITWTKNAGNPILALGAGGAWDNYNAGQATVWKEGSTWYMLYAGGQSGGNYSVGLATSADGITWTKDGANPVLQGTAAAWDSAGCAAIGNVVKEGSAYYFFYTGSTSWANQATWKIGLATSTDLVNWTKAAGNPILSGTGGASDWNGGLLEPFVQKFGSTYYMWLQANAGDGTRSRITLATSAIIDSGWSLGTAPILNNSPLQRNPRGWDDQWTEQPILVDFDDHWRLYFSGSQGNGSNPRMQDGYAVYKKSGVGTDTFLIFDDFKNQSVDTGLWTNSGSFEQDCGELKKYASNTNTSYLLKSAATLGYPIAVETLTRVGTDWANEYSINFALYYDSAHNTSGFGAFHYKDGANDNWWIYENPSSVTNIVNGSIAADTYYRLSLRVTAANQYLFVDGAQKCTVAVAPPQAATNVMLGTFRAAGTSVYTTYFDYVFARKFNATEPTVGTPGAEETASAIGISRSRLINSGGYGGQHRGSLINGGGI